MYDARASINDSETTSYQLVPNTAMLISVQSQSRISAVFSGYYYIAITSMDSGHRLHYNLSLDIAGVGRRFTYVKYQTTDHNILTKQIGFSMYLDYVTDPLPTGTYNVSVYWMSLSDHDGISYLTFNWDPDEPLRALWLQELS